MTISSRFAGPVAALFLLAAVSAGPAFAANCAKNPSHPSCPDDGGDGSGNQKWPSTLVFTDVGNKMTSDGSGRYVDNTGSGGLVEVFIGSSAKEGDIIMKLPSGSGRHVDLNFTMPDQNNPVLAEDCFPLPGGKVKTKFCGSHQMPFFFTVTPNPRPE